MKITQMNSKENNAKLNKKMQANPDKILEILRNKDLSMAEKAAQIEKISEFTVEEAQGGDE